MNDAESLGARNAQRFILTVNLRRALELLDRYFNGDPPDDDETLGVLNTAGHALESCGDPKVNDREKPWSAS